MHGWVPPGRRRLTDVAIGAMGGDASGICGRLPLARGVSRYFDRIVCVHMCGLLMRSYERWPRWFPQLEFPTALRPESAIATNGLSRALDRSITPSARFLQDLFDQLSTIALVLCHRGWPICHAARAGIGCS